MAKRETELEKSEGEVYIKFPKKRHYKRYLVKKIGYQLYYFNPKKTNSTDDVQAAVGSIFLDHITHLISSPPKKKKVSSIEKLSEKLGRKMTDFVVSTWLPDKQTSVRYKFGCPSETIKNWISVFEFIQNKYSSTEALLQNLELINGYTQFLLTRTPVFDWMKVFPALEKLQNWFSIFTDQKRGLPENFDMKLFLFASKVVFSTFHHKLIFTMLKLLYNHISIFNEHQREKLFDFLLSEQVFYPLFLSWNIDLQVAFHYLICFRVST